MKPTAWLKELPPEDGNGMMMTIIEEVAKEWEEPVIPLYSKGTWVGLTDALTIAYQSGYYDGKKAAQPAQESVAWMSNKDFEPIRVRIMQEAYELADRNDSEGYNAIKVMCGDVQEMLQQQRTWVELTDEELSILGESFTHPDEGINEVDFGMEIQRILKEKNNG